MPSRSDTSGGPRISRVRAGAGHSIRRRNMSERSPSVSSESLRRPVNESRVAKQPWYRRESWLAICFAAFIPITLALILPASLKFPLLGLGVLLAAIGLAMLVRKELVRMKLGDAPLEQ
jgi:hypothetical protein